ncbi:unnamed protein product [Rotaria magnacalcarata]
MGSILSEVDTRITTSRAETQQDIKLLEITIPSKDTMLTQVFDNIQSLTTGLHELKELFTNHHTLQSPTLGHPLLNNPLSNIATPIQANSPHFINSSAAISYELPPINVQPINTIVLPPTTSLPTFSGKYTESTRQFLIRVEEYARTVNSWSRETLLRGISQFLKDDAFEWYCQLCYINTTSVDWNQFVVRFLAQFHSPIQAAQQEQAWIECKQFESETINQFVVRLRSIWLEQKPHELESDFTKHRFFQLSDSVTRILPAQQPIVSGNTTRVHTNISSLIVSSNSIPDLTEILTSHSTEKTSTIPTKIQFSPSELNSTCSGTLLPIIEVPDLSDPSVSIEEQVQLSNLIQSFPQVFTKTPGRTSKLKHHIDLIPDTKARNSAPYRYTPASRKIIDDKLDEMREQHVIIPSKSPWASPVVLALKKDGLYRLCIDYRKLNEVTVRDAYPIPRIDDTLDALQYAQFISTLDLRSGYWQVEMEDSNVQAFLGITGYYHRFIKNDAKIAEPLLKLLHSQQPATTRSQLPWNADCTNAFITLKQKLISPPIMHSPNFSFPFILELDACEYGIGCILTQDSVEREALAIVWGTKHFRQYLEGGPVLVQSDCKALEWLKTARNPTDRLARWAMKLSPYHIIIQHRPGKSNANGDFVSRYPITDSDSSPFEVNSIDVVLNILEGTNILEDIRAQQQADPQLARIIETLKEHPSTPFGDKHAPYLFINDLLYKVRHINSYNDQRLLGNKHLLAIPQSLQHQILTWAHDHPTAGHAGRIKKLFRLPSRVYWHLMRKDVYKYVQSCIGCQQFKYSNTPTPISMQLHIITEPWHTIGVDIMAPFPPIPRQKRYLLVIVDYFTRWVEMFALRRTTATDISNIVINEVICRYGIPTYI